MFKKILQASLFVVLVPSVANAEDLTKTFDAKSITKLDFSNGSGKATIGVSKNDKVQVVANKVKAGKNCLVTMEQSGTTLNVKTSSSNSGFFNNSECEVDYVIELPKVVDIELKVGSGSAKVRDTKGKFNFKTGSGEIDFNGEATEVEGRSGSGEVALAGIIGNGDLMTGSGDLTLTYSQVPLSKTLDIRSGSGDATIYLPESSKIKTKIRSGSGQVSNAFGEANDAGIVVNVRSGSGDLKVVKK